MTQSTDINTELLKRMDAIAADVAEIKTTVNDVDTRLQVFQARTEEKFNSIDQRLANLETRGNAQETRFWTFVVLLITALRGLLAKVAFFPVGKV